MLLRKGQGFHFMMRSVITEGGKSGCIKKKIKLKKKVKNDNAKYHRLLK